MKSIKLPKVNNLCFSFMMAGAVFSATASADNSFPHEIIANEQGNFADVVIPPTPTPDFNPLTAPDDDLAYYGFPPKPNQQQYPDKYERWQRLVTIPSQRISPQFLRTTVRHKPSQSLIENGNVKNANTIGVTSTNWSGYADLVATGAFKAQDAVINAQFAVPTVTAATCNNNWEYASEWVGFDGATQSSSDVLQAGILTGANCSGSSTSTLYGAWIEWYPNPSYLISNLTISPGDSVDVEVWYTNSAPNGHAYIADYNTGLAVVASFTIPAGSAFSGNSAEWVIESPEVNGVLATLPNYLSDTFTYAEAYTPTHGYAFPSSCSFCSYIYDFELVSSGGNALSKASLIGSSGTTILFTQP